MKVTIVRDGLGGSAIGVSAIYVVSIRRISVHGSRPHPSTPRLFTRRQQAGFPPQKSNFSSWSLHVLESFIDRTLVLLNKKHKPPHGVRSGQILFNSKAHSKKTTGIGMGSIGKNMHMDLGMFMGVRGLVSTFTKTPATRPHLAPK